MYDVLVNKECWTEINITSNKIHKECITMRKQNAEYRKVDQPLSYNTRPSAYS